MILTQQAIATIKASCECRRELIYQMEISHQTLYRALIHNKPNGLFTTVKAISIITEYTGLTQEQILIDEDLAMELSESDCHKN